MSEQLVLTAIGLHLVSGAPGLAFGKRSLVGQYLSTLLAAMGSLIGLAGSLAAINPANCGVIAREWFLPLGEFRVAIDGLSIVFLVPIFVVSMLGAFYGLGYWKQTEHEETGNRLRFFYGLLAGSLATVVIARNGVLFLFGWEGMALSAFFLVSTEDHDDEVRNAGWVYLLATHLGTLSLFAFFTLWQHVVGTYDLRALAASEITPGMATTLFLLALTGFGLKAGIMPLHVWLPGAHSMAPSHVSAIMSGVIIKMGVYGVIRVCSILPHAPVWWGALLLALGALSGVLGIAFALGQRDFKRMLAYSSIENIGIIFMGIGLAMLGRSLGQNAWVVLGLGGALWHVWNHAFFKSLLFFGAGSLLHGVGTRSMDRLGGLIRAMPVTACCFLIGAAATCALPPMNGFVGELLIYVGLIQTLGMTQDSAWPAASFAAPALAMVGAMALACFANAFGRIFLGVPRTESATHAHESPWTMLLPMALLAATCLLLGLLPAKVSPVFDHAVSAWTASAAVVAGEPIASAAKIELPGIAELGFLNWVGPFSLALLVLLLMGWVLLGWKLRTAEIGRGWTWGCGYAAPTARMQYSSSSFAQMLVGLFSWALLPKIQRPRIATLFPSNTPFQTEVPDPVLDRAAAPAFKQLGWLFSWLRLLQQGQLRFYLLYIFVILIILLLWR